MKKRLSLFVFCLVQMTIAAQTPDTPFAKVSPNYDTLYLNRHNDLSFLIAQIWARDTTSKQKPVLIFCDAILPTSSPSSLSKNGRRK